MKYPVTLSPSTRPLILSWSLESGRLRTGWSLGESVRASTDSARTVAVIVAGGVGRRLKAKVHKPFVRLAGRPMLIRTLQAFERARGVDGTILVVHRRDLVRARALVRRYGCRKVAAVVPGGPSRMESVACGLKALPVSAQWVAVHDGARPLITPGRIRAVLRAARSARAAILAVPVVPTIKRGKGCWVTGTLDRKHLWAVQTPQVFERKLLERAHAKGKADGRPATDDAALVEHLGVRVRIVPGSDRNIKVTTPEDLLMANIFLRASLRGANATKQSRF